MAVFRHSFLLIFLLFFSNCSNTSELVNNNENIEIRYAGHDFYARTSIDVPMESMAFANSFYKFQYR